MARQISTNDLKGKTFYTNIKGKVVACRFTCLIVYLAGEHRVQSVRSQNEVPKYMSNDFGYVMECADGSKLYGNCKWLPEIYETIDDCVNKVNSLKGAYIDEREVLMPYIADEKPVTIIGQEYTCFCAYHRNKNTFKIELTALVRKRYDILNDKLLGDEKYFKSYEDCQRGTTIEVVTF